MMVILNPDPVDEVLQQLTLHLPHLVVHRAPKYLTRIFLVMLTYVKKERKKEERTEWVRPRSTRVKGERVKGERVSGREKEADER